MDDFGKQSQAQQNNPDHEHWQAGQKTGGCIIKAEMILPPKEPIYLVKKSE